MASHQSTTRRVLVLNHYAKPLSHAGGTRHVELFGRLRGWHWSIVVAGLDHVTHRRYTPEDPHFVTVPVTSYTRNDYRRVLSWFTYSWRAFLAGLRQPRPDVVYASTPHILAPVTGWALARLRRARFVLEVRDLWPEAMVSTGYLRRGSAIHRLLQALEHWIYRRADRIVMVAHAWHSYFGDAGVDPAKLVWVSNGAEPDDFRLRPDTYQPLRDRVPVRGKLFVFAGSHGPINGLDRLLDAVAEVPEHTFVLIGDGHDKEQLVLRARTEGLTNIHFLDAMPKEELRGVLGGADVGVHVLADSPVYRMGASPNKLYDYLAAGIPVINNCPGEPEDILVSSGSGLTVETDELAAGLRKLAELDDASLREMGRHGRRYVEEHRSRTIMAARLQRLLDEVIGRSPAAS
ncbi:glycosyltransferase family 4 protein [Micromonospora sp. NPDC126480]|uniref:glycosyltransferase family 4 protein n=1 Tax=Micromonospora sp. NPDC126480 TaxID=3155312 RepID=UPI0033243E86